MLCFIIIVHFNSVNLKTRRLQGRNTLFLILPFTFFFSKKLIFATYEVEAEKEKKEEKLTRWHSRIKKLPAKELEVSAILQQNCCFVIELL